MAGGDTRPKVLAFVDYYLPGYRAGGPMRSLSNLVAALADDYDFHVVTRNHDAHVDELYAGVEAGRWEPMHEARVMYFPDAELTTDDMTARLADSEHALIYFNSLFSLHLTVLPLRLLRKGRLRAAPVIVAPRGELSPGHLRVRPLKFYGSLWIARLLRLFRGVTWHATSELEVSHIRRWFPRDRIVLAPNLSPPASRFPAPQQHSAKHTGRLRMLFLSRIHPKKNLNGALAALTGLRGEVEFDIAGPIGDPAHWAECEQLIARLPDNIRVRHLGAIDNARVPELLADYDLFYLPTHGENHGHAIVEAMLGSCPVLLSRHTPWRDLPARRAGWDVATDAATLADVLQRVIDMDEDEHLDWRGGARAYAERVFGNAQDVARSHAMFAEAIAGVST